MKVSKNKVTLLSLAVAGLFAASAAQAQVLLNPPASGAVKFASEIAIASTGQVLTIPVASPVRVTLGFGFSGGQDRYVRFDLPTGVTWGAAITAAMLTDFTTAANFANVALSQGGAVTDSFVVFQVTAAAGGVPLGDVLNFAVPGVKVSSTTSVPITYNLHETAISAAGATPSNAARLVGPVTGNLITFTPAINIVASTATVETVAAIATLFKFCSGALGTPGTANCIAAATDVNALVGGIATYAWNTGPILSAAGVDLTGGADFSAVISAASVTATGDFGAVAAAAGSVGSTVAASAGGLACNPPYGVAGTNTATVATYPVGIALMLAANNNSLCVTANGTAALPAQSFTGSYVPTYVVGYAGAARPLGTIGTWVRDGAELQSPWFAFGGTRYISRFFFMNTGANATTCTSTALAEAGNTLTVGSAATTGFTIPAGGQVAVLATDVASAATGATRAAVRFVCLAPTANIQGRYVITDTTSGALDSGALMRPGTN